MAKFHDLLDSIGHGEDGVSLAYPETFMDEVTAAYDEDMSIPASRVSVLEADLAAAQAEIVRLKAHNYELITAVPVESDENDGDPTQGDDDNDDENADEGVDSLFGDDKEED